MHVVSGPYWTKGRLQNLKLKQANSVPLSNQISCVKFDLERVVLPKAQSNNETSNVICVIFLYYIVLLFYELWVTLTINEGGVIIHKIVV